MQPSDGFWEGVGTSVGSSPGWMVIGALLVVGVLIVVAKYIYPGHKELKMRELDIREREADNDAARIEANRSLAEQTRSCRESVDVLATQQAATLARLNESADRSHQMGGTVDDTHAIAKHNESMLLDLHKRAFREGTE